MRTQGQMVMGRPLTSDGGAFCKGNRETQVNVTGRGLQGQEPCLSLCQAVEPQPASSGLWAGVVGLWVVFPADSLPGSGLGPRETMPPPSGYFGVPTRGSLTSRLGGASTSRVPGVLLVTRKGQELALEGWALVQWGWVSPRLRGRLGKGAEGGGDRVASFNSEGKEENGHLWIGHTKGREGSRLGSLMLLVCWNKAKFFQPKL